MWRKYSEQLTPGAGDNIPYACSYLTAEVDSHFASGEKRGRGSEMPISHMARMWQRAAVNPGRPARGPTFSLFGTQPTRPQPDPHRVTLEPGPRWRTCRAGNVPGHRREDSEELRDDLEPGRVRSIFTKMLATTLCIRWATH